MAGLIAVAPCFAQESPQAGDNIVVRRDVRVVNGKTVDLSPVHAWYLKRDGERPMKHWKKLEVCQLKGPTAGWERCVLKDEEGGLVEVFVGNLPAAIRSTWRR